MARVFVEARPKGRPEGSPIEDYVVEDHADHVLQTFKTQHEAIEWAKKTRAHAACRSRPAPERQGKARSLARGLGFASTPDRPATWRGAPAWYTLQAFSAGFLRDLAECVAAHHIRTGSTSKSAGKAPAAPKR